MIVLAHISDTHLDGSARNADRATRVLRYLNNLPAPVDAVLVTGDIADHGLPAEYEQARKIPSSQHPPLHCPGNHDARRAYREVLLGVDGDDAPVNQVHRVAGAVVAMCDSSIPGRADGLLDEESMAWLERVLAEAPSDAPAFGHAHTPVATTFAGRPLLLLVVRPLHIAQSLVVEPGEQFERASGFAIPKINGPAPRPRPESMAQPFRQGHRRVRDLNRLTNPRQPRRRNCHARFDSRCIVLAGHQTTALVVRQGRSPGTTDPRFDVPTLRGSGHPGQ